MALTKEQVLARAKTTIRTGHDVTGVVKQLVEYINSIPEPKPIPIPVAKRKGTKETPSDEKPSGGNIGTDG
jgi:hypothetical protein